LCGGGIKEEGRIMHEKKFMAKRGDRSIKFSKSLKTTKQESNILRRKRIEKPLE